MHPYLRGRVRVFDRGMVFFIQIGTTPSKRGGKERETVAKKNGRKKERKRRKEREREK